jgi:hypothetical protein
MIEEEKKLIIFKDAKSKLWNSKNKVRNVCINIGEKRSVQIVIF